LILIFPEIQLRDGKPVHCINGSQYSNDLYEFFRENPDKLCQLWRRENAKTLHILDYNSVYEQRQDINLDLIKFLASTVDIPFEVFAYFNTAEECKYLLENGVYRVIIDELAITDPESVADLIGEYTASRIAFNIYLKNGKICLGNKPYDLSVLEYVNIVKDLGANRIIFGDDEWERPDKAMEPEVLEELGKNANIRITVANGVKESKHLWQLNDLNKFGIDSVIMGEPLYQNHFPCQEIWRSIEAELETCCLTE
jgi:phosphoribosylformimino-5-aminoimidazole carboxamide ribotide isomerase